MEAPDFMRDILDPLGDITGYMIKKIIGRGAFGVIYKAYDTQHKRDVAIKAINLSAAQQRNHTLERIYREVYILRLLATSNYVSRFYTAFQHMWNCDTHNEYHNTLFIVMELVNGVTLTQYFEYYFAIHVAPAAQELWNIMRELATAVNDVHSHGVAHRDIKPCNVMWHHDTQTLKLIDFGLSCCVDYPQHNIQSGTVMYMSPEHINGTAAMEVIPAQKHDVWSLGVMCFQMAHDNKHPLGDISVFVGTEIMRAKYNDPVTPSFSSSGEQDAVEADLRCAVINFLIDWMLTTEVTLRPLSSDVLNYIVVEDEGAVHHRRRYQRHTVLRMLRTHNIPHHALTPLAALFALYLRERPKSWWRRLFA